MRFSPVLGGVVSASLLLAGILLGSSLLVFVDGPSALIFSGGVLCFLLQAHGPRGLQQLLHTTREWLFGRPIPAASRPAARGIVESGMQGTRLVAVMGPFIGGIQILQSADLPLETLGPALAVMLLIPFYAACLKLLYWGPLQAWLEQPGRP